MDDPGLDRAEHEAALRGLKRINLFSRGTDLRWDTFKHTRADDYVHHYPEILDLKENGGSSKVIDFMINTPSLYPAPPSPPRLGYRWTSSTTTS